MATAAELAGATTDEIAEARTAMSAHLDAAYPSLSVSAGDLADLLLGPSADALAAVEHRASAAEASLDPETALAVGGYDEEILAAALAGRGVTRGAAAAATGTVALKFSTSTTRNVGAGYRLHTADGVYVRTTESVRMLAPGSTAITTKDRVMVADPAGGYVGTVAVAAEEDGASGNRPAGTVYTADTTLDGQTAAYASADVSGGADAESDADLLARLPAASAPRTTASFEGAAGVVQNAYDFSFVSAIGYGHAGMRRGRSVLTGQTPGRADVMVRVSDQPGRVRLPVTATYIGVDGPYGQWRFTVAVGDAPGWFVVERVVKTDAVITSGGYAPTVVPGYDVSAASPAPDVRTAADAFFSAYATAQVTITDPDTSTGGLTADVSTKTYDAVLRVIPGVDDAQTACDDATVRAAGGDCVVKAAPPVMVSLTVAATVPTGVTLTADEVEAAVASAVNASGIGLSLYASVVGASALALLPAGTTLQLSAWTGVVYKNDGTTGSVSGSSGLVVVEDWSVGLGSDSVAYYCDPESVSATVTTV